ncbi:MAG: hydrogenase 3 maturation endopeptidase HyCI [Anaerolineaceae bacterium]|nr:hydrogenase 3 maturation endopeptidase HyCI [Anaerolineaceae bacterium]
MLAKAARDHSRPRVALVGMGNALNGDDAAGVLLVRQLQGRVDRPGQVLVLDTGVAPENYTGPLRRFAPHVIVMVDAVQMGAPPGEITWVDWAGVEGFSASTHTLPPSLFADYVRQELGCPVGLLGIQAAQVEFDRPVTPAVQQAVDELTRSLAHLLNTFDHTPPPAV